MTHYRPSDLVAFATAILRSAGLNDERAGCVARILVEGDLFGHTTHGLALLDLYASQLVDGGMTAEGEPITLSDFPAAVAWDGRRLPGPWLVVKALELATARARQYGSAVVTIQKSHHIAALAAYLEPVAREGLVAVIMSSDPNVRSVAPFGGSSPVMTPNPVAAAWPTADGAVMMDVSMSVTAAGVVARHARAGKPLPHDWLLDEKGQPTNDSAIRIGDGGGSVQPLGGMDAGHKGFALGLFVEALTSGLAGYGRARPPVGPLGASVMVQVFDPRAFGGLAAFTAEAEFMAAACHASPPGDPARPVRVPGEAAFARKAKALAEGLVLHPEIAPQLQRLAERFAVALPAALAA
jgi:L-lactate dehydrogenase